jgi:hypothetical protein
MESPVRIHIEAHRTADEKHLALIRALAESPPVQTDREVRIVVAGTVKDLEPRIEDDILACYHAQQGVIMMGAKCAVGGVPFDPESWRAWHEYTLWHEAGHALDFNNGPRPLISTTRKFSTAYRFGRMRAVAKPRNARNLRYLTSHMGPVEVFADAFALRCGCEHWHRRFPIFWRECVSAVASLEFRN